MKFKSFEAMVALATKWVRDGSDIIGFYDGDTGSSIILRGKDGIQEIFTYFSNEEYYKISELIPSEDVV